MFAKIRNPKQNQSILFVMPRALNRSVQFVYTLFVCFKLGSQEKHP